MSFFWIFELTGDNYTSRNSLMDSFIPKCKFTIYHVGMLRVNPCYIGNIIHCDQNFLIHDWFMGQPCENSIDAPWSKNRIKMKFSFSIWNGCIRFFSISIKPSRTMYPFHYCFLNRNPMMRDTSINWREEAKRKHNSSNKVSPTVLKCMEKFHLFKKYIFFYEVALWIARVRIPVLEQYMHPAYFPIHHF